MQHTQAIQHISTNTQHIQMLRDRKQHAARMLLAEIKAMKLIIDQKKGVGDEQSPAYAALVQRLRKAARNLKQLRREEAEMAPELAPGAQAAVGAVPS